jgi:hypothetical protein
MFFAWALVVHEMQSVMKSLTRVDHENKLNCFSASDPTISAPLASSVSLLSRSVMIWAVILRPTACSRSSRQRIPKNNFRSVNVSCKVDDGFSSGRCVPANPRYG